jgi:hypothetical protein
MGGGLIVPAIICWKTEVADVALMMRQRRVRRIVGGSSGLIVDAAAIRRAARGRILPTRHRQVVAQFHLPWIL